MRRKYKGVVREIKAIKSDFTQKDLERLFPIVVLYCMKTPLFYDELEVWAMEDGWDREWEVFIYAKNMRLLRLALIPLLQYES